MQKVYVLELEDGNYYVGYTDNGSRINYHLKKAGGSEWTRLHKPIRVVEVIDGGDKTVERDKTLEYMERYGWEKVRGYAWTACNLKYPPVCLATGNLW